MRKCDSADRKIRPALSLHVHRRQGPVKAITRLVLGESVRLGDKDF